MFSSRSFIVSGLTFRSLIHFELIFVYGVRADSMDMSLSKPLELVMDTEAQRPAGHGVPKSQTRLSH